MFPISAQRDLVYMAYSNQPVKYISKMLLEVESLFCSSCTSLTVRALACSVTALVEVIRLIFPDMSGLTILSKSNSGPMTKRKNFKACTKFVPNKLRLILELARVKKQQQCALLQRPPIGKGYLFHARDVELDVSTLLSAVLGDLTPEASRMQGQAASRSPSSKLTFTWTPTEDSKLLPFRIDNQQASALVHWSSVCSS